jgi:hypothetical protein
MRRLAFVLFAAATPLLAQAPARPDYSGKWVLDAAASSADAMSPSSASVTITQTDKALKLDQTATTQMGTTSYTLNYNLDGTDSKNTVNANGMSYELTSTTAWDGSSLVLTTSAPVQGGTYKTVDRWSLDATGKVLTVDSQISFGPQSMSRKQVFKKQ